MDRAENFDEDGDEEQIEVLELDDEDVEYMGGEDDDFLDENEVINSDLEGEATSSVSLTCPKMSFNKHKGSVFCCKFDCSQSGDLAACGGEDDRAYVWDTLTGDVVLDCSKGHEESIIDVQFSSDGRYLASGDMKGTVLIHDLKNLSNSEPCQTYEINELEWLLWHSKHPVLFGGDKNGDIWMWNVATGDCKVFPGGGVPCNRGQLFNDGLRLLSAYEDGTLKINDLKTKACLHQVRSENSGFTAIDIHPNDVICAAGNQEGVVSVINANTGKSVSNFRCSQKDIGAEKKAEGQLEEMEISVECCLFSPNQTSFVSCTLDGMLGIWDLNSQTLRHACTIPYGITRGVWCPTNPNLILVSTLEGYVYQYDDRTGKSERQWAAHIEDILDMAISKNGDNFMTSSDDSTVKIFSMNS